MILAEQIESAEKKYRQILEEYFIRTWGETGLFSHDIDHHRRVWHYAKELLTETMALEPYRITFRPEELIVACYLHDIGMSIDPGERHGIHSSLICRDFLSAHGLPEDEFSEVLTAILIHDKKEYFLKDNSISLQSLLSAADDLDAFGYIGVYRYAEIYLLRGVDLRLIGRKVRKNIHFRFHNFSNTFRDYPELIFKHKIRFNETDDFWRHYSNQVRKYNFESGKPSGYCGVIEIISEIIHGNISFDELLKSRESFNNDQIINIFVRKIQEMKLSSVQKAF